MTKEAVILPESLSEMDGDVAILQFITGNINGSDFWAYVAMVPSKYQEYKEKVDSGVSIIIANYGDILESGEGLEPPLEIKEKMALEYGADDEFENQIYSAIEEAVSEQERI